MQSVGLDGSPQRLAWTQHMRLPYDIIEGLWPHSGSQWLYILRRCSK
jgi:hypothetical protein